MEWQSYSYFAIRMCGLFGGVLPPRRLPGWFQELRPQLIDVILSIDWYRFHCDQLSNE